MKNGIIVTGLGLLCTLILAPVAVALGVSAGAGVAGLLDGAAIEAGVEQAVEQSEGTDVAPQTASEEGAGDDPPLEAPSVKVSAKPAPKNETSGSRDRAKRSGASSSRSSSSSRGSTSSRSSVERRPAPKVVEPEIDEFLLEEEEPIDEDEEMDIDSVMDNFEIDMLDEEEEPKKKRKKKK